MKYRPSRHYLLIAGLLVLLLVTCELYLRLLVQKGGGENVPLAEKLETVPMTLGNWGGLESPIPPATLMKIGAEDTLSRDYGLIGRRDVRVHLYIAYFGGIRGTAPHHPDVCMPGAGYDRIDGEIVTVKLKGFGDEALDVHKDVFERTSDQQKRLVVWWEYVYGENVASRWKQRLMWMLPGFMGGKRGSVLQVQASIDYTGDTEERAAHVMDFIDRLGPHIERVLPKPEAGKAGAEPQ